MESWEVVVIPRRIDLEGDIPVMFRFHFQDAPISRERRDPGVNME
jgi:hypothetical protein